MEMILGIFFLAFTNAKVEFRAERLSWSLYTTIEALPIARLVEQINKQQFARATLDENSETLVVS